ncbi:MULTISPECIES: hypothetical protein [unclassified Caballeronia]|uniref:hypothetical protein n=1 Tax=unclassified Caballeronia TaxID=2646786 RepID=UPI00285E3F76|nr:MULTISPECIES: hypothetical protein [unclassified Caballeronia]MDR5752433.1 hypothetical protein [Caballeronia sp. LZ024]MDR5845239.1 hypothetical protein [Caballeronia sp. LZ031]
MALTALEGDETLAAFVQQFATHPNRMADFTKQLQERLADVFEAANAGPVALPVDVKVLGSRCAAALHLRSTFGDDSGITLTLRSRSCDALLM